ncbi:pyrroloquinoline quinone biosynthesis protein PqqE [Thiohalorhabdus methylotrophus]|uniref:PqqA peptide cyclase n=1 Tax=Thiohalorhabdus methylotrophus TaxID=3242694 RepID=A0ABV4TX08_9GAMM
MRTDGYKTEALPSPRWLLAEVTYRCPLQCVYCSNPVEMANYRNELDTEDWFRIFREARELGAVQLGFSGGEPLLRKDLEDLVAESSRLGYYTNLITSGVGMSEDRVAALKEAGLDHIQISFQASNEVLNDYLGGNKSFQHKMEMAHAIKRHGYPMVLNVVLHRHNLDQTAEILDMAEALEADYVELANTQYYGWAWLNQKELMPSLQQVRDAEAVANRYKERLKDRMQIYYVIPDYFEKRPKPCMNGWGNVFLGVAPDGAALPCHIARQLPGLEFPNLHDVSVREAWFESEAFNHFRGFDWMKEPCRSCSERFDDFGGCRCQAYMLTGDPANTDPVCEFSPHHDKIVAAGEAAKGSPDATESEAKPMVFRNMKNSKVWSA